MKNYDSEVTKVKARNVQVFKETTAIIQNGYYIAPSGKRVDLHMKSMIAGQRCYHKELTPINAPKMEGRTGILVLKGDCLNEAGALVNMGYNPAVLNFASAGHPGGGVETGARAQEESICRRSTLSRSLFSFEAKHAQIYGYPLYDGNHYPLTKSLDFSMIYSPNVTVFREAGQEYTLMDHPFNIGVITNAALNLGGNFDIHLTHDGHMPQKAKDITRNKIRSILRVGLIKGHDSLVLGAFGCGAFHNPPKEMAQLFKEVIAEDEFVNRYRLIVFAILSDHNDKSGNFKAFQDVFDPDADIFEGLEKYRGHWSEHKDLLHEVSHKFKARLNAEAEAAEKDAQVEASSDAGVSAKQPATKGKKSPKKGIRVTFPDGTVIQEKDACDTFIKAIQIADANKVRDEVEGLILAKRPLISDKQESLYDHRHRSHPIPGTNLFVNTQASTERKKLFLEKISAKLGLKWKVEIV